MDPNSTETIPLVGISDIQGLILPTEGRTYSLLWHSWHYLQVYSVWGLRLPATQLELKSVLSISNPGDYPFFGLMQSGNTQIKTNCEYFQVEIFPVVLSLARNLLNFSKMGTLVGMNFFGLIVELLKENKFDEALEIAQELKDASIKGLKVSNDVQKKLSTFFSQLTEAKATLNICQQKIEEQDEVSSKTVKTAMGDVNTENSLANLQKKVDDLLAEYNHAKVVAATTPSYAFVGLFGLIAAVTVAIVYGVSASNLLKAYDQAKAELEAANQQLKTALATQNTLKLSNNQLVYILDATAKAIDHTNAVRNAWSGIIGSLETLSEMVKGMITKTDEKEVLRSKNLVIPYCEQSEQAWRSMVQPLTDLVTDPYIKVEESNKSISELANDIDKEAAKSRN